MKYSFLGQTFLRGCFAAAFAAAFLVTAPYAQATSCRYACNKQQGTCQMPAASTLRAPGGAERDTEITAKSMEMESGCAQACIAFCGTIGMTCSADRNTQFVSGMCRQTDGTFVGRNEAALGHSGTCRFFCEGTHDVTETTCPEIPNCRNSNTIVCPACPEATPAAPSAPSAPSAPTTQTPAATTATFTQEVLTYNDPLAGATIPLIMGTMVRALLGLAGALYLAYFIYGGFVWMTAGGEAEKVKTAQKVIVRSVAGVAIVMFSYTLLTVLLALMSRIQGT